MKLSWIDDRIIYCPHCSNFFGSVLRTADEDGAHLADYCILCRGLIFSDDEDDEVLEND